MALRSTIYKADLSIADIDRGYYADHALTIARHPSETEERMMLRVLAFAMFADGALEFGRGLSAEDEPDLWRRDLTSAIELWIEVGLPDERAMRKACGRAAEVVVLAYGGAKADVWWTQNRAASGRCDNLSVLMIAPDASEALARMAQRSMTISCTRQDGQWWFHSDGHGAAVEPMTLKPATAGR